MSKKLISQVEDNFRCFRNWVQWQLKPENVEIDDGDLDLGQTNIAIQQYKKENSDCKICGSQCTKNNFRCYAVPAIDKVYPDL